MIQKTVVYGSSIFGDLALTLFRGQKPFPDQFLQVNKIRVSGKGGKSLIGGIPIACRSQGKDLPEALAGFLQIMNK